MGFPWRRVLPLLLVAALILHEEIISTPSCTTVHGAAGAADESAVDDSKDLKVMLVANLLLLGSEAGRVNVYFRDYYLSKFFRKSFVSLKPDMLLVLGDVSAKGRLLAKKEWLSVHRQFEKVIGPFLGLPYHVVLGDRDIGDCGGLNMRFVNSIARRFPGLDSAGCGAFEISNISFVSLNTVALLCGRNPLRFSIEKVIERGNIDIQLSESGEKAQSDNLSTVKEIFTDKGWRENAASSGSGPILLLHFPLHHPEKERDRGAIPLKRTSAAPHESSKIWSRGLIGAAPYGRSESLPPNVTDYIFHALRPRLVFSAHSHEFYDHIHPDGIREVSVPAMTWDARDDPGFVIATFRGNRKTISISRCSLGRESHVLTTHLSILLLLILTLATSRR